MSDTEFAALLCSRLCHDLVSPVGAITNGIEILQEEHEPEMREQVMDLLIKSAQQTSNKLQFFRLAFGAAGEFSAQLDLREAQSALEAFLEGTRVEVEWQVDLPSASKSLVKLLMNISLIGAESLIRGGTLTVSMTENDTGCDILVTAKGDRIIMQSAISDALTGGIAFEDVEPRNAPAFLANTVAADLGGTIKSDQSVDKTLVLSAKIATQGE